MTYKGSARDAQPIVGGPPARHNPAREVNVRVKIPTAIPFFLAAACCQGARLTAPASQAFDSYIQSVEARLAGQHDGSGPYLACLNPAAPDGDDAIRQLTPWSVRIEPVHGGTWEAGGALLHHWRATAFVPGVEPGDMLALLRDTGHLARYYAPEVVSSRALAGEGATSLIRFRKQKVVTVVLDAEFAARSGLTAADRGYGISRSTHIWQIEDPGSNRERRRPEGNDDGFLWRLNSYWSFLEVPGGLLIECEAVSLTRNIPLGLGWLITPIIESLPRESLQFTLNATRKALIENNRKEARR
jgi:hypothetical protein